jgi:hypothetical protein
MPIAANTVQPNWATEATGTISCTSRSSIARFTATFDNKIIVHKNDHFKIPCANQRERIFLLFLISTSLKMMEDVVGRTDREIVLQRI